MTGIGGATPKFLAVQICCPRPTFYKQWPISHNIGIGHKQKSRVLYLHFFDQISALSKSCYYHIRELRCLRPYIDFKTASTIATSIIRSKRDYCNSLYYNLPQSQIKEFQNIQISSACAVTRTPKSSHITPVLKFLHWLKINERIKYKLLSLTYKVLTTHQPQYLHDFIFVQPCHNTRSSAMVTLARPPIPAPL